MVGIHAAMKGNLKWSGVCSREPSYFFGLVLKCVDKNKDKQKQNKTKNSLMTCTKRTKLVSGWPL